ncbi:glycosyltransferase family 4 protein [Vibrio splendidus]
MNILFICNEYPPFVTGGIGVFTKSLAEFLVKKGHNVYVFGLYDENKFEVINGVKIIRKKKSEAKVGNFLLSRVTTYFEVKKIIEKHRIDLIEVQDFHGLIAFFPKLKCKVVTRLHGSVSYFNSILGNEGVKNKIWRILEKKSIICSDKVVSCSEYTANKTKEIFNINIDIEVIYNGVKSNEGNQAKIIDNKKKKFLFFGSLIGKKGIYELVRGWSEFSHEKDVKLDIYGKDTEGAIKNLSPLAVQNSTIEFHSPIPNHQLQQVIIESDFCIFPTKAEAFSLAPMEAMSKAKVVLYNDQTSANELIIDGFNGLLIRGCNELEINVALNRAYQLSMDERNRISENATSTIREKFNVDDKNNQSLQMYLDLIS